MFQRGFLPHAAAMAAIISPAYAVTSTAIQPSTITLIRRRSLDARLSLIVRGRDEDISSSLPRTIKEPNGTTFGCGHMTGYLIMWVWHDARACDRV